jgi:hypothetical protein
MGKNEAGRQALLARLRRREGDLLRAIICPDVDGNQKAVDMEIPIHGGHEHLPVYDGIRELKVIDWLLES